MNDEIVKIKEEIHADVVEIFGEKPPQLSNYELLMLIYNDLTQLHSFKRNIICREYQKDCYELEMIAIVVSSCNVQDFQKSLLKYQSMHENIKINFIYFDDIGYTNTSKILQIKDNVYEMKVVYHFG